MRPGLGQVAVCVAESSSDPFQQPLLRGAKRARRLPTTLKTAVVDMAAAGNLARSNRQVMEVAHRFQHNLRGVRARSCNPWTLLAAQRYFTASRQLFKKAWTTLSVTLDGTRLAGKDQLWLAFCSPQLQKVAWAPPQVPQGTDRPPASRDKTRV